MTIVKLCKWRHSHEQDSNKTPQTKSEMGRTDNSTLSFGLVMSISIDAGYGSINFAIKI